LNEGLREFYEETGVDFRATIPAGYVVETDDNIANGLAACIFVGIPDLTAFDHLKSTIEVNLQLAQAYAEKIQELGPLFVSETNLPPLHDNELTNNVNGILSVEEFIKECGKDEKSLGWYKECASKIPK